VHNRTNQGSWRVFIVRLTQNNEENFFSKTRKMRTKLNIWQTCKPFTVGWFNAGEGSGRLSIDLCSINVTVPEPVIRKTQAELFVFFVEEQKR